MKFGVFLGALILGIGAYAIRSSDGKGSLHPDSRPTASKPSVAAGGIEPRLTVSEERFEVREIPVEPSVAPVATPDRDGNALPGLTAGFLGSLERELRLGAALRGRVEAILREREERIQAYHREIRVSGVFHPREYDRRTWDLRFESYRRIDALLDAEQGRRFRELLTGGKLQDAVAFELDDTLVVLDRSYEK